MSAAVDVFTCITTDRSKVVLERVTSVREMNRYLVGPSHTPDAALWGLWLGTAQGYCQAISLRGVHLSPKWKVVRWRNIASTRVLAKRHPPTGAATDAIRSNDGDSTAPGVEPGESIVATALIDTAHSGTWLAAADPQHGSCYFPIATSALGLCLCPDLMGCSFGAEWLVPQSTTTSAATPGRDTPMRPVARPAAATAQHLAEAVEMPRSGVLREDDALQQQQHASSSHNQSSLTSPSLAVTLPTHPADCCLVVLRGVPQSEGGIAALRPPSALRATSSPDMAPLHRVQRSNSNVGSGHLRPDPQLPFSTNLGVLVHGYLYTVNWVKGGTQRRPCPNESLVEMCTLRQIVAVEFRGRSVLSSGDAKHLALETLGARFDVVDMRRRKEDPVEREDVLFCETFLSHNTGHDEYVPAWTYLNDS